MAIRGVKTKLVVKDRGYATMRANLKGLGRIEVGVQGAQATKAHPDGHGMTVGEVAAVHELGLGVPKRSFLASWFDANEKRIVEEMRAALHAGPIQGKGDKAAILRVLGKSWAEGVKANIKNAGIRPLLSAETLRKRVNKANVPLFNRGVLHDAITGTYRTSRSQSAPVTPELVVPPSPRPKAAGKGDKPRASSKRASRDQGNSRLTWWRIVRALIRGFTRGGRR